MRYLQTYNESLRDKMKPKSEEESVKRFSSLSKDEMETVIYLDCVDFFGGDLDAAFDFIQDKVTYKKYPEESRDDILVATALNDLTKEELIKMFKLMYYSEKTNESLRDKMTPKSKEEILKGVDSFVKKIEQRLKAKDDFEFNEMIDIVHYIEQTKNLNEKEFVQLLIEEEFMPPYQVLEWMLGISGDEYGDEGVSSETIEELIRIMKL